MSRWRLLRGVTLQAALGLLAGMLLLPDMAPAQEEVTSAIRRYKEREASTGYYEEYEVKPRRQLPLVRRPEMAKPFPYAPSAARVRLRTNLADSHRAIQFYEVKRCDECHVEEAEDIHTTRANLTCRQCHGGEPIASINHYFSPMNPIRRHSYVCSKCHEGANISFASYIVHQPKPGSPATKKTFPALYYANWFMILLLVGVFAFFLPHSVIWVIRDFLAGKKKEETDDEPHE